MNLRKLGKARINESDLNPRSKRQRQELYWFMLMCRRGAARGRSGARTMCRAFGSENRSSLAVAPPPLVTAPSVGSTLTHSWPCPRCGAPMRIVERLTARQLFLAAFLADVFHDTS